MTNNTQPAEALRLAKMLTANEWPGHVTLVSYAQECVAELLRQHARITGLESALEAVGAGGVSGPLVGRTPISANAGEPTQGAFQRALSIRTAQGWNLGGDKVPVLYTDEINGEQVCRDDVWLCTTAALAAPPTAGFTAADMATANAQGFRDGVASLLANAGEPFGWVKQSEIDSSKQFGGSINLWRRRYDCDVPVYLAAPPTAQAEGWRQIETAPKDGTHILLHAPACEHEGAPVQARTTYGHWRAPSDTPRIKYQDGFAPEPEWEDFEPFWASWDGGFTEEHPPTHWMPLPPPPTSAEGVEHG